MLWNPIDAFEYNGIDKLIIEIEVISSTGNTFLKLKPIDIQRRAFGQPGITTANGVERYVISRALRFAGGSVDVITDGVVSGTLPFAVFANRRQFLFKAAELGANLTVKDVFVEIDYIDCAIAGRDCVATDSYIESDFSIK